MQTLNENQKIIQSLDDLPNAVGGLTAEQLKAKFDEGYKTIVHWLNDVMLPAFASVSAGESGARNIGIEPIVGLTDITNVQDALAGVLSVVSASQAGVVVDGSVTTAKLADNAVTTPKIDDSNVTTSKIADGAVTTAKCDFTGATTNIQDVRERRIYLDSTYAYGTTFPTGETVTTGRLFFKKL